MSHNCTSSAQWLITRLQKKHLHRANVPAGGIGQEDRLSDGAEFPTAIRRISVPSPSLALRAASKSRAAARDCMERSGLITWLHTVSLSLSQCLCASQVVSEPCFLFRAECSWVSTPPRVLHAPHAVGCAHGRFPSFLQIRCNREVYPSHPPLRVPSALPPACAQRPWIAQSREGSSRVLTQICCAYRSLPALI